MSPINFESDAVTEVKQEDLKSISALLQEQLKLEELIESLEDTLKMQKENFIQMLVLAKKRIRYFLL